MITRTAIPPTPIPTPSPILAPKDSPLGGDIIEVELAEGEGGGVITVVVVIVVVDMEGLEAVLGLCVVSVPFTIKSPFPFSQHSNALKP